MSTQLNLIQLLKDYDISMQFNSAALGEILNTAKTFYLKDVLNGFTAYEQDVLQSIYNDIITDLKQNLLPEKNDVIILLKTIDTFLYKKTLNK